MSDWLQIACRGAVVRRSLSAAVLVGTILVLINHGDRVMWGAATPTDRLETGLTCLVPYAVSTWAPVSAIRAVAGGPGRGPPN